MGPNRGGGKVAQEAKRAKRAEKEAAGKGGGNEAGRGRGRGGEVGRGRGEGRGRGGEGGVGRGRGGESVFCRPAKIKLIQACRTSPQCNCCAHPVNFHKSSIFSAPEVLLFSAHYELYF